MKYVILIFKINTSLTNINTMFKKVLFGGGVLLAVMTLAVVSSNSQAATDDYTFLVRGMVKENDQATKSINVYTTHASPAAKNDLAGNRQDFSLSTAKLLKWVGGKKVPVSLGSVTVGSEVVLSGVKKSDGSFRVSWLVINDRSFDVVGKLRNHDETLNMLTIEVGTSTYKQSTYVNKDVVFLYDETTEFMSLGTVIQQDELNADGQRVKVRGARANGHWELTRVWDSY